MLCMILLKIYLQNKIHEVFNIINKLIKSTVTDLKTVTALELLNKQEA